MRTAFDERGPNSQRVAWMVPYIYNVLLTPFQIELKAFRILLPGLYHDGTSRIAREQYKLRNKKAQFTAEADYSNYDRFIPTDMIRNIVEGMTDSMVNGNYWKEAAMYLHDDASIIWPDYNNYQMPVGLLFKPGLLGLMSGVKVTSETGSLVNSVVNAQALANAKKWSTTRLVEYLTQYADGTARGSKYEFYYVQSDDTLLVDNSLSKLYDRGESFLKAMRAAGLKGGLEPGDRFLMRHMANGRDLPVPARVFQNTLSNEAPVEARIIFLAGLAARTDGFFGVKTIDPFQTGQIQRTTTFERAVTRLILVKLRSFIDSANERIPEAVDFVSLLLTAADSDLQSNEYLSQVSAARKTISIALSLESQKLADRELTLGTTPLARWLQKLSVDRHNPAAALIQDALEFENPALVKILNQMAGHEHEFFEYARKQVGIDPIKYI